MMQQLGPNLFMAGVPTQKLQYFAFPKGWGRQRRANWCWAACVQMILNCHGVRVTEEEVVQSIYGALEDLPGSPDQILRALNGHSVNVAGRPRSRRRRTSGTPCPSSATSPTIARWSSG